MKSSLPCSHFSRVHYGWPLLGFVVLVLLVELTPVDLWWADRLYQWSGGYWQYEGAWFTSTVVHEWGRTLVGVLALALMLTTLIFQFWPAQARWRRGLHYLLSSTLMAGILINVLKEFTHVDCPWDLLRYGGDRPYVPLFTAHPGTFEPGACFPAGHASAAYAWLGVYYFCLLYLPRWRFWALGVVLAAGLLFGFAQQLRGAHFLSHDIWTAGICWAIASSLFLVFFKGYAPTDDVKKEKPGNR